MTTTTTTEAGVLEHLDPHTLILETNVRLEASIDPQFVASIKEHGVLTPISAVIDTEGAIRVRAGQRRTLAARQAGVATVPVYVRPDTSTDDTTHLVTRVSEQIVENDQRTALTEAERVRGMQQLLDVGVSVAKVAKKLGVPKTVVEAANTAAQSETALAALNATQLSIEQAATLAEFEDDPQTVNYLTSASSPGEFDHRVAEVRQQRAAAQARREASAPYEQAGYTVLDNQPTWSDDLGRCGFDRMCDTTGKALADDHPAHPSQRPQLWAVWLDEMVCYTDTRTGEEVYEDDVDWDHDPDADADQAEDSGVDPRHIEERTDYQPEYYCVDLTAAEEAGVLTRTEFYQRTRSSGPSSTEEDDQAEREAQRREKRKVIALNKLAVAAEGVRKQWVTERILTRKTAPKGAMLFIAAQLATHPDLLGGYKVSDTARELLGLPEGGSLSGAVEELSATGDARAAVIVLAMVLAAMEADTDKTAWRSRGYRDLTGPYLQFLADNGYDLADVEKVMLGQLTDDALFDAHTAEHAAA